MKKDTSKLKINSGPDFYDEWNDTNNKTIKKAVRCTEYVFSITGDDTVQRTNYLIEKEYLKNVPERKWANGEVWEKEHKKGDFEYTKRTETSQKFLCVGGPMNGLRSTDTIENYKTYNAAGWRKDTIPRVILVHTSVLER